MKINLLSYSDTNGGASRAAYRLHGALLGSGVDSRMMVRVRNSDDKKVDGPHGIIGKLNSLFRPAIGGLAVHLQKSGNKNYRSANWVPSAWAAKLNASDAEVVNLHWVGAETLSIEDVGRIHKPLVWTLHDMWAFCGAEHYADDGERARWRVGYGKSNRLRSESGFDIDRWVWQRKRQSWRRIMQIVAPSKWLADCARESRLFRDFPVKIIPNVLDTEIFQPLSKGYCRQSLGLPQDRQVILFGAMGGGSDPRKGYDLLLESLLLLSRMEGMQNVLLVVFGQSEPEKSPELHFPVRWMGHVHDEATLVLLYNSADVMVVPSRQENLPQTATEAQACGCPVVAFDCSGFKDAVAHQETGYLAKAFDTTDMAWGLKAILAGEDRRAELGQAARKRALKLWAPEVVVPQYLSVYQSVIEQGRQ